MEIGLGAGGGVTISRKRVGEGDPKSEDTSFWAKRKRGHRRKQKRKRLQVYVVPDSLWGWTRGGAGKGREGGEPGKEVGSWGD